MTAPWAATSEGLRLQVRLTPRGGRDAIDGVEEMADGEVVLKARVRAAPSEGEANAALTALIASSLAVPRSSVRLVTGSAARRKTLLVVGEAGLLARRLEQVLASG
jgi:uncharacterized protein YggU (UPF0235/DUF167 family)